MEEANEQEGKRHPTLKFIAGFILGFLIVVCLSSIFWPWGPRCTSPAKRAICGANLKEIGKGVVLYAGENNDMYPPDLAMLVQKGHVSPLMLTCPASGTERAATTLPADIEAHCDYIYVSGFDGNTPGNLILAFELPANHGQELTNTLYIDTHVGGIRDMNIFAGELQRLNEYIANERGAKR